MCSKHLQKIDELSESEVGEDKTTMTDDPTNLKSNPELTLTDIMHDDTQLEHFKTFLRKQFALQDLNFWIEAENFCISKNFKNARACQIRRRFLNQQYFLGPLSPATKEQQLQIFSIEAQGQELPARPSSPVIREAQKYARDRLEHKWIPMYMETSEFKQRHLVPKHDDGRKKSVDLTNSQENSFLHQLRDDHISRDNFIQFLAVKQVPGQFLVNDLNFWLDDEQFKEMYRNDVMMKMLERKMQAMITCYLLSPVPPKLQLDIPQGIADKVTKKEKMSQYIFREAQASVFKSLSSYCTSFQKFVDNHSTSTLPFKELKEEAIKRRQSYFRREDAYNAYHAYKRPTIVKRNKLHNVKQRKTESSNKKGNKVTISFKLSEFDPQYETLSACKTNVSIPRISNANTQRAEDSKLTKTSCQIMKTAKPTTYCSKKLEAKSVSLPPIHHKHSKNASSKTHMYIN